MSEDLDKQMIETAIQRALIDGTHNSISAVVLNGGQWLGWYARPNGTATRNPEERILTEKELLAKMVGELSQELAAERERSQKLLVAINKAHEYLTTTWSPCSARLALEPVLEAKGEDQ